MSKKQPSKLEGSEESAASAERRIRKKFNVYMSQTSKYNPFGANSITSSYEDKVIYKYNLMKEYIKLTKKDALNKEYEQSRYLGVMILGLVGGYFAALAITTILQRGRNLKKDMPAVWDIALFPVCMTAGFAHQYLEAQERYNTNVCKFILNKYLPQAVANGFEDYQISQ